MTEPTFFETPADFRGWLAQHAGTATALVVGFYKRDSGRASITWPESVDEALCVGWIDGVRKGIDAQAYQIRFTPRKTTSVWSAINIERVRVLQAEGRMQPAGLQAFAHRREARSKVYAYEQAEVAALEAAELLRFRECAPAWAFFEAQPPGYRQRALWHVLSAKRADTREKRLARLIEASAQGKCL